MTSPDHHSGTERLAEVIAHYGFADDQIIANVQGDEPLIPPVIVRQVAENRRAAEPAWRRWRCRSRSVEEAFNPNAVKVVMDAQGYALYFSRATIPWDRERFAASKESIGDSLLRHIGIYAYRAGFVRRYVSWAPSQLEQIELLEQLRVLWYGENPRGGRESDPERGAIRRKISSACATASNPEPEFVGAPRNAPTMQSP